MASHERRARAREYGSINNRRSQTAEWETANEKVLNSADQSATAGARRSTRTNAMLSPLERASNRHPELYPEWTWMTEGQAALVLKANGYDFIFHLERAGQFWRGKAMRDGASYHVAINRYAEVFGHMDRKSLVAAAERAQEKAAKPSVTMLATLNGPVAASTSRVAPTV